jgi:hypothetical protein
MPIINRGVFDLNTVYLREVGNDWPTAQVLYTQDVLETAGNLYYTDARVNVAVRPILTTANVIEETNQYFTNARAVIAVTPLLTTANVAEVGDNLYFTNARTIAVVTPLLTTGNVVETNNQYFTNARVLDSLVNANVLVADLTASGNIVANGLIIRGINVTDSVLTGNITITNITNANIVSANIISSQVWQNLYSGNVIESQENLFFSNTRARNAFIAGRGIIIMDDGTIKSTIGTENFNTQINLGQSYTVTSALAPALTIASTPVADRYLVRSMHLTNISENAGFVSANVLYATGNTATLANLIPVPVGGIVEFMDRIQILQPGDKINVQGFDNAGTPATGIFTVNFSIEQISNDPTYYGTSFILSNTNVETRIVTTSQSFAVVESVKFVNTAGTSVPVRLYVKDANSVIKSYLAYNTQVPPNSSLEILQTPKNLEFGDTLNAMYTGNPGANAIAVFPSYRYSSVTTLGVSQASGTPGANVVISFTTTIADGTTLYYTLE